MTLRDVGHHIESLSGQEFRDYLNDQIEKGRIWGAEEIACPGCGKSRIRQGIALHLIEDDGWTPEAVSRAVSEGQL